MLAPTPRAEFLAGVRAELPILLGVVPFGMIYGVLALEAGLAPAQAQAMSSMIFAGSAQFITTQLLTAQAPGLVVILTVAVVNLRHALYSASVAPYTKSLSRGWKFLLAYLLTDEAYAVTITHYQQPTPLANKHWFFFGSGLALWSAWQLSTALGILLGAVVPDGWSLDFSIALTFIALLIPAVKDRHTLIAALAAGLTAVLALAFPFKLGLVAAALVGVLAGYLSEALQWKSG